MPSNAILFADVFNRLNLENFKQILVESTLIN